MIRIQKITRTMATGTALLASAFFLMPASAQAQLAFAAEGRVGVTAPTGDLSDAGASTGLGFGAELQVNFHPRASAYAGLYRHQFGCDDGCLLGDSPRSSGLTAGLKYIVHNPGDVLVWGRGGLVFNTLTSEDSSGDREVGFEVGLGADMSVAPRVYLVPHLGFVSHGGGGDSTASFFTFGVGLHYHIN